MKNAVCFGALASARVSTAAGGSGTKTGRAGLLEALGAIAFVEHAVETVTIFGSTGFTQMGGDEFSPCRRAHSGLDAGFRGVGRYPGTGAKSGSVNVFAALPPCAKKSRAARERPGVMRFASDFCGLLARPFRLTFCGPLTAESTRLQRRCHRRRLNNVRMR